MKRFKELTFRALSLRQNEFSVEDQAFSIGSLSFSFHCLFLMFYINLNDKSVIYKLIYSQRLMRIFTCFVLFFFFLLSFFFFCLLRSCTSGKG